MIIIYIIKCLVNNKLYIGQTINDINSRFKEHVRQSLKNKYYGCSKLARAITKHGKSNFTIEKLDEAFSQSEANSLEDFYILAGNTINHGYNIRRGGTNGRISPETLIKMREAKLGSKNYWFGKPMHRNSINAAIKYHTGRRKDIKQRQKQSQSLQPLNTESEKYCPKCQTVKPNDCFYKRKMGTIYTYYILYKYCMTCESQRNREKYKKSTTTS